MSFSRRDETGIKLEQLKWMAPFLWKVIVFLAGASFALGYAKFEFNEHQKEQDKLISEVHELKAELEKTKVEIGIVLGQHEVMIRNEGNMLNAIKSYKELNDKHFHDFIRAFESDPNSRIVLPRDEKPVAQRRK